MYRKTDGCKLCTWPFPRNIPPVDYDGEFVFVPGRGRETTSAAFENTSVVVQEANISAILQSAVDELNKRIKNLLNGANSNAKAQQLVVDK